jgi:hypothetical protein
MDFYPSGARFFSPGQEMILEFAHGRIENKTDPKHNEDIGENRQAFKEPLGSRRRQPDRATVKLLVCPLPLRHR